MKSVAQLSQLFWCSMRFSFLSLFSADETGQLYKQFAGDVSPYLCSFPGGSRHIISCSLPPILLKPHEGEKNAFFKKFESIFTSMTDKYVSGTKWIMHRKKIAFGIVWCVYLCTTWFFTIPATAFVPQEDQGYLFVPYFLPMRPVSIAPMLSKTCRLHDESSRC